MNRVGRMRLRGFGVGAVHGCVLSVALAAAVGCGQGAELETEEVGSSEAAITRNDYQDGSGTILLRVKTCDYTASATANCAYCAVDDGWARIGGGAEILGENTPGASLRQSYPAQAAYTSVNHGGCTGEAGPNDSNSVWVARSSGPSHQLRAYVVGLRLRETPSSAAFKPYVSMGIDRVTGSVAPPAAFSVDCSESELFSSTGRNDLWLVGGGAQLQPVSSGSTDFGDAYLTGSYPLKASDNYTNIWRASARHQQTFNSSVSLKCYGIGIEYCPAGWSDCFHHPWIRSTTAGSTSGYATANDMTGTSAAWTSWVPTGPGGRAQYGSSGFGRYLTDLIPFNGSAKGFTVRSKPSNSGSASSGVTNGASLALGRYGARYLFNSIRFNTPGTALFRPSGAAPVNLQQSNGNPDTAAHRFHLEPFGSNGEYRVRHGNPDNGTECAYRQTGSTSVRVGPCGTSSAYLWTVLPGNVVKLRNVSAGMCLDNNNQGATTSNLVLKTCAASYSDVQSVFFDTYSWPPM
jgi:hypothetical protein